MAWKPDYITTAEFKTDQGIGDTADDARIARDATAASRAVDRATNRQFGKVDTPEARRYTARWDGDLCRWVVDIDDIMTAAGLTFTTPAGAIDQYDLWPYNAAVEGMPWTRIVVKPESAVKPTSRDGDVSGTGSWGWTAPPVTVKDATMLQTSRFFKRKDAPFGIAGSPDAGSEMRLLARVDPDVAVMLGPYIRWWAAA